MRTGTLADVEFCADAMIRTGTHMPAADPYTANLPKAVREEEREYVRQFIGNDDRVVLIEDIEGRPSGVLMAEITASNFEVAYGDPVGYIAIAWVAENVRRRGVMRRLLEAADEWFVGHGVELVELSYLTQNALAARAWSGLGFRPFRVQAYRRIVQ